MANSRECAYRLQAGNTRFYGMLAAFGAPFHACLRCTIPGWPSSVSLGIRRCRSVIYQGSHPSVSLRPSGHQAMNQVPERHKPTLDGSRAFNGIACPALPGSRSNGGCNPAIDQEPLAVHYHNGRMLRSTLSLWACCQAPPRFSLSRSASRRLKDSECLEKQTCVCFFVPRL